MKITDLHIDGFGVWSDLTLENFSPEITVFYGPNEAGKTTLMQFLRSVLYGVSAERHRYLPPVHGGRPGGWLGVDAEAGCLRIERYADRSSEDVGRATVITADGRHLGDRLLDESLEGIDETTFNNVYAVGLREMQELGTLSDTEAAILLYRLTTGLDHVSVYDVIQELQASREKLLSGPEKPSMIVQLAEQRDQLRRELEELMERSRRWSQAAVKLRELDDQIESLQALSRQLQGVARQIESAIGLRPLWNKRLEIVQKLCSFDGLFPLKPDAVDELDRLNGRIEEHQRQRDIVRGQRRQLREEADELGINELLVRNAARLDALAEQQDWLASLERQEAELAAEVDEIQKRLDSESERLQRRWGTKDEPLPRITPQLIEQLTPHSKAVEATTQLVESAQAELAGKQESHQEHRAHLAASTAGGEKLGLPDNIEETNDLVAKLRRRLKVEQRLEQSRRQIVEMEEEGQELLDRQVMPASLFVFLLAVVVVGFVMVGIYLVAPTSLLGPVGGWLAAGGLVAAGFALLFKFVVERSAGERLDACQDQLEAAERQLKQAKRDQAELDAELPITEGSVVLRLQHAERHLAQLEKMLPVEGKRRAVEEEIFSAEQRLAQVKQKHEATLTNWNGKLRALGLPKTLQPGDLTVLADQCRQLSDMSQHVEHRRDEIERRQRELAAVGKRVRNLAEETGLVIDNATALEQLDHLLSEYRNQQHKIVRRRQLREKAKQHRKLEQRHVRAVAMLQKRRQSLFDEAGVQNEAGYRRLAEQLAEAAHLRDEQASASREITATIGKLGTEAEFAQLLAPDATPKLDDRWKQLSTQIEETDAKLRDVFERRGVLVEQQRAMVADRSMAKKQVELDSVEQRLARAKAAWQELAVVGFMLERIREEYERDRQPETLREATEYLSRMTDNRYRRVWTPLAHDILLVDTADGQSLPVEMLSSGAREQLYLSVRLALVALFARRGIHLPMILDDVLVNFDATRAGRAAEVLRDFARQGHQLFVFTCHEHVWKMFGELQLDVRRLPGQAEVRSTELIQKTKPPVVEIVEDLPVVEVADEPPVVIDEPAPPQLEVAPEPEVHPELPRNYEYPEVSDEAEIVEEPDLSWEQTAKPPVADHTDPLVEPIVHLAGLPLWDPTTADGASELRASSDVELNGWNEPTDPQITALRYWL